MTDRIHYPQTSYVFTTPRKRPASMTYRLDTSDWNTLWSAMNEDEYKLANLPDLKGTAVDIGAHIGSVAIGLALDNPDLQVIAVEPVPENCELLQRNVDTNGLSQRVTVLTAAAARPGIETDEVHWRYASTPGMTKEERENREHHAFIGNATLVEGTGIADAPYESEQVACVSISGLVNEYGPLRLLKIDCEGCEWSALQDPAVADIPLILGEWHPTAGKTVADLIALLEPTHILSFEGPQAGPQEFTAVRR